MPQDTWEGRTWEPWTKNLYAYGRGNPVNYVDPTGHASFLADYDPSIDLQLLELKREYANATTDEQRAKIAERADELRAANKGKYTVERARSLEFYLTGAGGPAAGLLAMNTAIALDPLERLFLLAAAFIAVMTGLEAYEHVPERYRVRVIEASKDACLREAPSGGMMLYRYWGGGTREEPFFWCSPILYDSPETARRMLALPLQNDATMVTRYWLPEGVPVVFSIAADMSSVGGYGEYATGGGVQVYIVDYTMLVKFDVTTWGNPVP